MCSCAMRESKKQNQSCSKIRLQTGLNHLITRRYDVALYAHSLPTSLHFIEAEHQSSTTMHQQEQGWRRVESSFVAHSSFPNQHSNRLVAAPVLVESSFVATIWFTSALFAAQAITTSLCGCPQCGLLDFMAWEADWDTDQMTSALY